jgi:hypothetical protein
MNTQSLLRESIVKTLVEDIAELQIIYMENGTPAFIRVEGGTIRPLFTSQTPHLLREHFVPAKTNIERLFVSDEKKTELLNAFDRMLPGTCLVVSVQGVEKRRKTAPKIN